MMRWGLGLVLGLATCFAGLAQAEVVEGNPGPCLGMMVSPTAIPLRHGPPVRAFVAAIDKPLSITSTPQARDVAPHSPTLACGLGEDLVGTQMLHLWGNWRPAGPSEGDFDSCLQADSVACRDSPNPLNVIAGLVPATHDLRAWGMGAAVPALIPAARRRSWILGTRPEDDVQGEGDFDSGFAGTNTLRRISSGSGEGPGATDKPLPLALMDPARQRAVPVVLYGLSPGRAKPLAVLSPGYGNANTDYGFLAQALVARGYLVAAIQQDLPGDPVPARSGDLAVLRRPLWQTGADSISFVVGELRARGLAARTRRVVLVGHSNGGDISMLLASQHPQTIAAVFSLDSRRAPFPRVARPKICSLRSSDVAADPGVLPDAATQVRLGMQVSVATDLRHDDMWDGARPDQKALMLAALGRCLDRVKRAAGPSVILAGSRRSWVLGTGPRMTDVGGGGQPRGPQK